MVDVGKTLPNDIDSDDVKPRCFHLGMRFEVKGRYVAISFLFLLVDSNLRHHARVVSALEPCLDLNKDDCFV